MIEPQNTMLPVAKSRPVDAPQGEGEGFGDMLAQTLGMIPQVDPSAVKQIDTGAQQGHADDENPGSEPPQGEPSTASLPGVAALVSPVVVEQGAPIAAANVDPPELSGRSTDPDEPSTSPSLIAGRPMLVGSAERTGVAPMPIPPVRRSPEPVPHVVQPVDTVLKQPSPAQPVVADPASIDAGHRVSLQPTPPANFGWPADPGGDPGQVPGAGTHGNGEATIETTAPDPGSKPPTMGDRSWTPVPLDASAGAGLNPSDLGLEPAATDPRLAGGDRGPTLPKSTTLETVEPDAFIPEVADAVSSRPATGPMSRVEFTPDRPIRLEPIPSATAAAGPVIEPVTTEPVSTDGVAPIAAAEAESSNAPGNVTTLPEGLRPRASALAERVMQAIDLQRTQPPPRSMVVDIPELEGLRLLVSVRSVGNVTVTPATGSANPDVFTPFATDLSRVLAERGFVMNGDGRQRGYNPHSDDEPAPASSPRPSFRRPVRTDNDLRI